METIGDDQTGRGGTRKISLIDAQTVRLTSSLSLNLDPGQVRILGNPFNQRSFDRVALRDISDLVIANVNFLGPFSRFGNQMIFSATLLNMFAYYDGACVLYASAWASLQGRHHDAF